MPSGDTVYASKRGYWRYGRGFLLKMKSRCVRVPPPPGMAMATTSIRQSDDGGLRFARNNAEKSEDYFSFGTMVPSMPQERRKEWCALKAVILEHLLVQKLSYEETRRKMQDDHDFVGTVKEYRKILHLWYSQGQISRDRRGSSLERGQDEDESSDMSPDTNEEDGLQRIITLDSDMSSVSPSRRRLQQDDTKFETASSGHSDGPAGSASPNGPDDLHSALDKKMQQDQAYFAQKTASASGPEPSLPPHSATNAAPLGTADHSRGSEADPVNDEDLGPPTSSADDEEDPPPYNPAGWIWP